MQTGFDFMDFLQEIGKVALGSRLRRLGEVFAVDAAQVYEIYGVDIQPKWFPVFYILSQQEECSITAMSKDIGCSHPVVSQVVKEMGKAGLIETGESSEDARMNVVKLSPSGRALIPKMEVQMQDVSEAVENLFQHMQHDFWQALEEMEFLLEEKSFLNRVVEQRKQRESEQVKIVEYTDEYHEKFKQLNYEWIERDFTVEEEDRATLEDPQGKILTPGGAILIAIRDGEVVGTCALVKKDSSTLELVKMAVATTARKKNVGWKLGTSILEKARSMGAEKVYVESNTKLKPAINLYRKLGFEKVIVAPSPYQRCNIQMEVTL